MGALVDIEAQELCQAHVLVHQSLIFCMLLVDWTENFSVSFCANTPLSS